MIRDELMQRVVSRDVEPIIPFIDRGRELYEGYGISTILVAGSCGSYFHKADCIIQMNKYQPVEITVLAKKEAEGYSYTTGKLDRSAEPDFKRIVKRDAAFAKDDRIKMRTDGSAAGGDAGALPGNLAMTRRQELYAALNRCRELIRIEE